MAIADQLGGAPRPPGNLPKTTKAPLDSVNPLLSCGIARWLQIHGKTVKPKLSEEQRANLRTCFRMMDADGSGAIDADELGAAFKLLGLSVSRQEVGDMLAEVDRDGSGEVEYAEFLEIMTLQLTRLAAAKDEEATAAAAKQAQAAGADAAQPAGQAGDDPRGGGGEPAMTAAAATAAAAALLPFDVVVTAYRRKKLMAALEEDDKDFILSVAATEAEERQRAEQEAQQAVQRARRLSAVALTGLPGTDRLPSHASFLASLSSDERCIIESLSKKYRGEPGLSAAIQQQQQQGRQASPLRSDFKVQYQLGKQAAEGAASGAAPDGRISVAAAAGAGAAGDMTQGLRLLMPQFSSGRVAR